MITNVLNIFAQSPFKPIQDHMTCVFDCASHLDNFSTAVSQGDWEEAKRIAMIIRGLEQEGDELKKAIRLHLPNNLFMPVSRFDLLELLTEQDKIANQSKAIANLVLNRRIQWPTELADTYHIFLIRALETVAKANQAVHKLDELLDTGFTGRDVQVVKDMIHDLDELEDETDQLHGESCMALFGIERRLPAVDVIFMYKVLEWTSELADRAQRVGHRLQLLLAK